MKWPLHIKVSIAFQVFCAATICCSMCFVSDQRKLVTIIAFTVLSQLFGIAGFILSFPRDTWWKKIVLAIVVYHALIGPVFTAHSLLNTTNRNDSLALKLYPHVVGFIDGFE